jgi:hypothetical protein
MPATCAASAAARERAASLLTVPARVATPLSTEELMGSDLRASSLVMRVCRAAVRLASSVGTAEAELLHPAKLRAIARALMARRARVTERVRFAYMKPLSCVEGDALRTL